MGVFKYSEEEGTHGAKYFTDNVPDEVKQSRYEEIMLLQQKINFNKNKSRVGSVEKVVIDFNNQDNISIGRSVKDAPEIDNYVKIDEQLDVGKFYNVEIKKAYEYDVLGEVANV